MQPKPWETRQAFIDRRDEARATTERARRNFSKALDNYTEKKIDKHGAKVIAHHYVKHGDILRALVAAEFIDQDTDKDHVMKIARRVRLHPAFVAAVDEAVCTFTEHDILTRDRVLYGLFNEAVDRESGMTTGASRVAAWAKLAQLTGLEAEAKRAAEPPPDPSKLEAPGGVLLIPFAASIEEWERAAIGQQAKLKEDVRN